MRTDGWWRDKDALTEEVTAHDGNNHEIARSHGCAEAVVRKWRKRHGLGPSKHRGAATPQAIVNAPIDDGWLLKALKKRGDQASVDELADYADVSPKRVREALTRLGRDGYRVEEAADKVVLHRVPPPSDNIHRLLFKGDEVVFGVVSDTHLGSKHERLEELHNAYRVLEDEGVTEVFHPGDLVCGSGIFPGQINEIHQHTYEDQVDYAEANYPVSKTITTRIIAGNHDIEGVFGKVGANPVVAFCNRRPDFDMGSGMEAAQGALSALIAGEYADDDRLEEIAHNAVLAAAETTSFVGGDITTVQTVSYTDDEKAFAKRMLR